MWSPIGLALSIVGFAAALRRDQIATNDSSDETLCTAEVVDEASVLLGEASKEHLSDFLALEEDEADRLLNLIGLSNNFTYSQLCEHAVGKIREVLHVAPPLHLDEACLSADCSSTVNVSVSPPRDQAAEEDEDGDHEGTPIDEVVRDASSQGEPVQHIATSAQLLRRLLAIVFHVFPDTDVDTDDTSPSQTSLIETGSSPMFDASIRSEWKADMKATYARATSWVSSALRKLNSGRSWVEKWFKTSGSSTDAQIKVTRRLLTSVFDSMGSAYVKYMPKGGTNSHCTPGRVGYIHSVAKAPVSSGKQCGTKERGRFLVMYCDMFIKNMPVATNEIPARTVIHEHTHHFCTEDKSGWRDGAIKLSRAQAAQNADSYAILAKDLYDDRSLSASGPAPRQKPVAPAPAPSGGGGGCFPPTALVGVAGAGARPAALLAPGDKLVGLGKEVNSYILDFHEDVVGRNTSLTTYLRVEHELQKAGRPLLITANHLLYVAGENQDSKKLVPASELRPGKDALLVLSNLDAQNPGEVKASLVTSIERVLLPGFSAPLSSDGTLFVEGVLVSSYALLSDAQLALWQRGPSFFRDNAQAICHLLAYPFRLAHSFGLGSSFLTGLSNAFDGLSAGILLLGQARKV